MGQGSCDSADMTDFCLLTGSEVLLYGGDGAYVRLWVHTDTHKRTCIRKRGLRKSSASWSLCAQLMVPTNMFCTKSVFSAKHIDNILRKIPSTEASKCH